MSSLTNVLQPSAESLAGLIEYYERAVRAYFPTFVSGSTPLPQYSAGLIYEQVQEQHFRVDLHQVLSYRDMCDEVQNLGHFISAILHGRSTITSGSAKYRSQLAKLMQWCARFDKDRDHTVESPNAARAMGAHTRRSRQRESLAGR